MDLFRCHFVIIEHIIFEHLKVGPYLVHYLVDTAFKIELILECCTFQTFLCYKKQNGKVKDQSPIHLMPYINR